MQWVTVSPSDGAGATMVDTAAYRALLPELLRKLPKSARAFATAPGRFDAGGKDPLRNRRFGRLTMRDSADGTQAELVLRGYVGVHTTDIVVFYLGVQGLSMTPDAVAEGTPLIAGATLGRSVADELRPDARGVVHEVRFHAGSLSVLATDIDAVELPMGSLE